MWGQTSQPVQSVHIHHYRIDASLDPVRHLLKAETTVSFTALENAKTVSFKLNPALTVAEITDENGATLEATRGSSGDLGSMAEENVLRVTPATPLHAGDSIIWTFRYRGILNAPAHLNAAAPQLAFVGNPVSYLLYPAQWFPTAGDSTDRFTAVMHIHVPASQVLASGPTGTPHLDGEGRKVFDFDWALPGFPGTVLAGNFTQPYVAGPSAKIRLYRIQQPTRGQKEVDGQSYAATASRIYSFLRKKFGALDRDALNIVELPDGSLPAYSAPELAVISAAHIADSSPRLLANTIAHQWWGEQVSPSTLGDAWITNGMCRYAELSFMQSSSEPATVRQAVLDTSAAALAYDTIPLRDAGRRAIFSPKFEWMTYDKGAMIFRMLQWQIGDAAFESTLQGILSRAEQTISSAQLQNVAESASHQNLQPFFWQWIDSTGAPRLQARWTTYRLGNNQGFRTVGTIEQNLDLFRMPVEMRIETEGKPVTQRVEVVGPHSQFVIDSFGMPKKVSLDPQRWLLRDSPDMQVRVQILRGQQELLHGDEAHAISDYQRALAINNNSSLASYRLGEVYFRQRNYQAAADAFRAALRGDGIPKWIEVWSDLQLGNVFDASGQRDRALNEYREALQTGDNAGGALD
ncbi:MAG TPA: M1 family aminopeptidase, partial [Acidobacteriaceae bacterium]|nr:M1 family aminopeptidase [Acidobacteriaceae bacterium]